MTEVATAVKPDTPTMDQRIAQLLKSPDGVSAETIALHIRWAKASATVAENAGRAARLKSVDPQCVDGIAERSKAEDQEFIAQRCANAVEALTPLLQAATRQEEIENWKTRTADLRQRVTDLSKEFQSVYVETTTRLVELFKRCAAADAEVMMVNNAAPGTIHSLSTVEGDIKIIPKVKLPTLGSGVDAWPLPVIPIGVQLHDAMISSIRNARPMTEDEKIAESMRVTKYYEEMEQGRVHLNEAAAARAREQRRAAGV